MDLSGFEAKVFPAEQLHSTKSGQVRAEFADAEFVFDLTAARLKDAGSEVYYLEDPAGGHMLSDVLSHPDLMADRMTFLINKLF